MLRKKKIATNIGVGIGFPLQIVGRVLLGEAQGEAMALIGLVANRQRIVDFFPPTHR
jgi:hypothetical protein